LQAGKQVLAIRRPLEASLAGAVPVTIKLLRRHHDQGNLAKPEGLPPV
jgi:hypothetical protein